jgi:hypothetical protein
MLMDAFELVDVSADLEADCPGSVSSRGQLPLRPELLLAAASGTRSRCASSFAG